MKTVFALLIGIVIGSVGAALASAAGVSEEVRVAVRSAGGGFVGVGISHRLADGSWSEAEPVPGGVLDSRSPSWQFSDGVEIVPADAAVGEIQVRVTPDEIIAVPSTRAVSTRCTYASLTRHPGRETVWMHVLDAAACTGWQPPERLLSVRDSTVEPRSGDPQYARVTDWLFQLEQQAEQRYGNETVSLEAFQTAISGAYRDFFRDGRQPPRVVFDPESQVQLHDFNTNRIVMPNEEIAALDALAGTAFQLAAQVDSDDPARKFEWSGPELAAQVLAVFERYLPQFDVAAARARAAEFGVRVAAEAPVQPGSAGASQVRTVQRVLRIPQSSPADPETGGAADDPGESSIAEFTVSSSDGDLAVRSELGEATSRCRNLRVVRGFHAAWVRTASWGACEDTDALTLMGFSARAGVEEDRDDPQQYRVYDWERQTEANLLPDSLNDEIEPEQAQRITDAVFADLFGSATRPPRVRPANRDDEYSYYTHQFRQIRILPGAWDAATVLHETVHAALAVRQSSTFARWDGHGQEYAATILMLWERYMPGFDAVRAREAAALHGVDIADISPIRPVGGAAAAAAVSDLLGLLMAEEEQGDCTYFVQVGDTYFGIALRHGMTMEELRVLNPQAGDFLEVGQEIVVRCP